VPCPTLAPLLPFCCAPLPAINDADPLHVTIDGEEGSGDGVVLLHAVSASDVIPAVKSAPMRVCLSDAAAEFAAAGLLLGGGGAPSLFYVIEFAGFKPAKPCIPEAAAAAAGLFGGGCGGIPATFFLLESAAMRPLHTMIKSLGGGAFGACQEGLSAFAVTEHLRLLPLHRFLSFEVPKGTAPARRLSRSRSSPSAFAFGGTVLPRVPSALLLPLPLEGASDSVVLATAAAAAGGLRSHPIISRMPSAALDDGAPQPDALLAEVGGAPPCKGRLRPLRSSLTSALGAAAKLLAPRPARARGDDVGAGGGGAADADGAEPACPAGGKRSKRKGRGVGPWFRRIFGRCGAPEVEEF
jgi:hypothetical protein